MDTDRKAVNDLGRFCPRNVSKSPRSLVGSSLTKGFAHCSWRRSSGQSRCRHSTMAATTAGVNETIGRKQSSKHALDASLKDDRFRQVTVLELF